MKSKLTVRDIILTFIKLYAPVKITNVDLQTKICNYGKQYNVFHSPETYVREWRKIKSENIPNIEIKPSNIKGEYICTLK